MSASHSRPPRGRRPLTARLERAAAVRATVVLPPITYPESLPVSARRQEIAQAIATHQVVIVAGETGSGKTTQLPKILLELGRGRAGQIGHTQPRRIAARTVAERIAHELAVPLGGAIGYQVRFTDESSDTTLVKVMTDGILLAQIQHDPDLLAYDTIVIDEAHERSLNIDFLLGYLTRLLPRRPDLKLVITSATIDSARFAEHFAIDGTPAPVIEVTGRTYPVEIRYRPLLGEEDTDGSSGAGRDADRDLMTAIVEATDELASVGPGDILVFLSGEREIHDAADALGSHLGDRTTDPRRPDYVQVLPLFSRLSAAEQHRVFESHPGRRIVLATNVAETSLTVPGVRYVVDPGTARISRWSRTTKVQRLPIEPISQASAAQRAGRCGRVADGVAIRLYSQEDLAARPEFTEPEILRTSLAAVILQMLAVGVVRTPQEVADFPFVDQPDTRAVRDGVAQLVELGALRPAGGLTDVGRKLARLPMDPRVGRMVLAAGTHGVGRQVVIIAAALSIQDVRERPTEARDKADELHGRFTDPTSDFLTYLNLWEYLRERQRTLSGNQFRRTCRAEFINFMRVREWQDLVAQVRQLAREVGVSVEAGRTTTPADTAEEDWRRTWPADDIHRSLLTGLLSGLGMQEATEVKASSLAHLRGAERAAALRRAQKRGRNEYLGARGARFAIFPGSPLAKRPPAWVMAGELVETSRLWARDVAAIKPEWAVEIASHLVRRSYSEPRWSRKQGAAVVHERVLLYGLPLVAGTPVPYARVDPEAARDLFIRHALVGGEWVCTHRFWRHNAEVLEEAREQAARVRDAAAGVDEEAIARFYETRIPAQVFSQATFEKWWRSERRTTPHLLDMALSDVAPHAEGLDPALFPDHLQHGDLTLGVQYRFEPGAPDDGVTVQVPLAVLPRLTTAGFDWLVPGLLEDLCIATVRALPKKVRVELVPAPDTGRAVAQWLREHPAAPGEPFADAFVRAIAAVRGITLDPQAVHTADLHLPSHLRMRFEVLEDTGRAVALIDEDRDLGALQRRLAARAQDAARRAVRTALRDAFADARSAQSPASTPTQHPASAGPGHPNMPQNHGRAHRPDSLSSAHSPSLLGALTDPHPLTAWPADLPDLPDSIEVSGPAGLPVVVRPGLLVRKDGTVVLQMVEDPQRRDVDHARAVVELLARGARLSDTRVTTRWTPREALALAASPYPTTTALVDDLHRAAVMSLIGDPGKVRSADAFAQARATVAQQIEDAVYRVAILAAQTLSAARELDATIRATSSLAMAATLADVRQATAPLIAAGFISATPPDHLADLPRYLTAARERIARAAEDPHRDAADAARVAHVVQLVDAAAAAAARAAAPRLPPADERKRLVEARFLIEELRVSVFAQKLGTRQKVSEQRIAKLVAGMGAATS